MTTDFKQVKHLPQKLPCDAKGCEALIADGETYIEDKAGEFNRGGNYCSWKCSETVHPYQPRRSVYASGRDICGADDCHEGLEFYKAYPQESGGLCCSEECATNHYNMVWGSDDGWREDKVVRELQDEHFSNRGRQFN